jgi:putative heme-binding domain-containing protein
MRKYIAAFILFGIISSCTPKVNQSESPFATERSIKPENALQTAIAIREEVAVQVAEGMDLSLWASDSLIHDPIAISIDNEGKIYYTSATRQENSEFDIRGHQNWMTASISFETVEDRKKFLHETFTEGSEESEKFLKDLNEDGILDWRDLAVEKEEIWWVADEDEDGVAESAHLYIKDFSTEYTDVANGVLAHDGDVYVAVAPDLWKVSDTDGNQEGDKTESLSHGYAVHIGFSGHGMSGVTVGPQGRIWWGIGDIGMNVTDKDGKKWEYPHQGVIVRCDPDGSNFEVYAAGLRNTHEFVFDKYGNLITEDNDGDHRGERERLMYVVHGSDAGWRANWQYGKYTDPDNNSYKVWMDEKMSIPRWDGQAAYIIPPIQNYVNGPTGMVYNPGTALGTKWNEHFFIAEFRGNPANSPIHAFTMVEDGAGFKLGETQEVVSGLLPTGLDFGPDGALYFGDWIDGWGTKDKGRIWKLDVAEADKNPERVETQRLLKNDFKTMSLKNLAPLLNHSDMRVRRKAQFEMVSKGDPASSAFHTILSNKSSPQMSSIHAIWGLAQLARRDKEKAAYLLRLVDHKDTEIRRQAIKMLGDVRYEAAGEAVTKALSDESIRVRMTAAEAISRIKYAPAKEQLVKLLRDNADKDLYIRHAASYALAMIGDADYLVNLKDDPSTSVRLAAVVALRRMENAGVKNFLSDKNELVVTEAARAINDDNSIEGAIEDLAAILNTIPFSNEPVIRRAINANFRLGQNANIDNLLAYSAKKSNPPAMRAEALAALSTWKKPSVLDRVDGRNRGLTPRDPSYVISQLDSKVESLLNENAKEIQIASVNIIERLEMKEKADLLKNLYDKTKDSEVKIKALVGLTTVGYTELDQVLENALSSDDKDLRANALTLIPESSIEEATAVELFRKILDEGTTVEQQSAFAVLGDYEGTEASNLLDEKMQELKNGELKPEISLDLLEAVGDSIALAFHAAKPGDSKLKAYEETLLGGNERAGRGVFFWNAEAQCVRCHSIYEWGGDAGPGLAGIGNKLSPEQILEALILPSARLSPGFGVLSVELNDGSTVAGVMEEESETGYVLKVSKDESRTISKADIKTSNFLPSSMPSQENILSKKEIRNLIAFLTSLKGEEL